MAASVRSLCAELNNVTTHSISAAATARLQNWFERDVEQPLKHMVGGSARLKVIAILAFLLALDAADKATVGAVAGELKHSLLIGNVELGWLVTASTGVGALVTLPMGILVDRIHRTRLLTVSIVLWSVAMAAGGASGSYLMLLLTRLLLGVVVAVTTPAAASLIGDYFRPNERGRIFGYVLTGELVGVAFGFLISGNVAAMFSWRLSFWILSALGLLLAFLVWRFLPEPSRGGRSRIPKGATAVPASDDAAADAADAADTDGSRRDKDDCEHEDPSDEDADQALEQELEQRHIESRESQILRSDPANLPVWQAVRYILSISSFRSLMIAAALGYFYFTGVRTFAVVFMSERFGLGQGTASSLSVGLGLGAVAGVMLAGWGSDALIRHGRLTGRVLVGGAAYLLATAAFPPALFASSLWVAGPFLFLAAAGIGGANPAVSAARLDVIPPGLWGRAEGVQATVRLALEAVAPPLFGWISASAGAHAGGAGSAAAGGGAGASAQGLQVAFVSMLLPLGLAGVLLLWRTRKTYERDVVTAMASDEQGGDET